MKKTIIALVGASVIMSSCSSSNAAAGTYVGAQFGTILGSAIGGIIGGPRGSDIGTVIGMASGAAIGAAVGQEVDNREQAEQRRQQQQADVNDPRVYPMQPGDDAAFGVVPNEQNDVIDFDGAGPKGGVPSTPHANDRMEPVYNTAADNVQPLQIRKVRISYAGDQEVVYAGDECTLQFEIMNLSNSTVFDVQPLVVDESSNKHIHISPNLHVERISPNAGIRYTATILADKRLKDGVANIRVSAMVGGQENANGGKMLTLTTKRRR